MLFNGKNNCSGKGATYKANMISFEPKKGPLNNINLKTYIKHCAEPSRQVRLHCGYKKKYLYEYLYEKEHYEDRGLGPKSIKERL